MDDSGGPDHKGPCGRKREVGEVSQRSSRGNGQAERGVRQGQGPSARHGLWKLPSAVTESPLEPPEATQNQSRLLTSRKIS